jgi:hypothetical protein
MVAENSHRRNPGPDRRKVKARPGPAEKTPHRRAERRRTSKEVRTCYRLRLLGAPSLGILAGAGDESYGSPKAAKKQRTGAMTLG